MSLFMIKHKFHREKKTIQKCVFWSFEWIMSKTLNFFFQHHKHVILSKTLIFFFQHHKHVIFHSLLNLNPFVSHHIHATCHKLFICIKIIKNVAMFHQEKKNMLACFALLEQDTNTQTNILEDFSSWGAGVDRNTFCFENKFRDDKNNTHWHIFILNLGGLRAPPTRQEGNFF